MTFTATHKLYIPLLILTVVSIHVFSYGKVFAETVSGNGYTLNQAGQVITGIISGGGYQSQGVFGSSSIPTVIPPIVTPPSGGGGGGGGGWGYYVLPATTTTVIATTSRQVNSNTILTTNGSSCSSRIALSAPVDVGLKNDPEDVKKLQTFLNTYEKENLKVTGIYGKADYLAVKRWQAKYKANILTPMKLKNPTGTVYTSSMRQIERQTTATCGQQIVVHTCPYFKTYTMYGDKNEEVKKIQQFLNIVQGEKLAINGKYDSKTVDAAKRFQRMYRKDIVSIVTLSFISGNWNVSTRTKANEIIGCDKLK
jgi:peptidoglycan hydrolase-like protein with peptidoglycan-binding domain